MKSEDKTAILPASPSPTSILQSTRRDFETLLNSACSSSEDNSSRANSKSSNSRSSSRLLGKSHRSTKSTRGTATKDEQSREDVELVSVAATSRQLARSFTNSVFWHEKEDDDNVSSSDASSMSSASRGQEKTSTRNSLSDSPLLSRRQPSSDETPSARSPTASRKSSKCRGERNPASDDTRDRQAAGNGQTLTVMVHQSDGPMTELPKTQPMVVVVVHAVNVQDGLPLTCDRCPVPPQCTEVWVPNKLGPASVPVWNQALVFRLDQVASASSVLFLVELLCEKHELAWAFVRPQSRTGVRHVNKRVRLQLFRVPVRRTHTQTRPNVGQLFEWFRNERKEKYPATLHVTLLCAEALHPPGGAHPANASLAAVASPLRRGRLNGQPFRLPTRRELTFSRGAAALMACYHPNGVCLAVALSSGDIYLHYASATTGPLRLRGHTGNVYDLDWARTVGVDPLLLSCGSDSTARVWNGQASALVMAHPAYVYSARFGDDGCIATACYDQLVRLWQWTSSSARLVASYTQHTSPVNCLVWGSHGTLFSADSGGAVCAWKAERLQLTFEKVVNVSSEEYRAKTPVNWLSLDPCGARLLVHYRGNSLSMYEPKSGLKLLTYNGVFNARLRLTSSISPCGSYVVAGSEDGSVHWFDLERGDLLAVATLPGSKAPITAVAFHPTDHAIALCSLNAQQSLVVLKYDKGDFQVQGFSLVTFPRTVQSAALPMAKRIVGGQVSRTTPTLDKLETIFRKLDLVTGWSNTGLDP